MITLIPIFLLNIAGIYFSDKFKIENSICYTVLLITCLDIMYFASLIDMLLPVTICLFLVLTLTGVLAVIKICKKQLKLHKNIYMSLLNYTCIAFAVIFSVQKPLVYYWDEVGLWGPSAKSVKLFNKLYSIGLNPCPNGRDYPVGNSIVNYFFSFFTKDFSDHILLLSYALLYFAIFCVIAQVIYKKTNNHKLAIGSYFFLVLSPFASCFHSVSENFMNISYAYGTTMVDFNLTVVFAVIIALYVWDRNSKLYLLPMIFILTVKRNGIFLALLAFCIISCFELFSFKSEKWNLKKAVGNLFITLIVLLVSYQSWFIHLDFYQTELKQGRYSLKDENPPATQQITNDYNPETETEHKTGPADRNQTSIKAIFIPSLRSERYKEVINEMKWFFLNNSETIYMKDKYLIVFLLALGVYCAAKQNKHYKLPVFLTSIGLTLGCFVYNLVIAYQMQFYTDMMVEYPRYMLSYYFSWIYAIFILFIITPNIKDNIKQLFLTVILVFTLVNITKTGLEYTVINSPDNVFQSQAEIKEKADAVNKVVDKASRIYLVYPDADGYTFNSYKYRLLPSYTSMDTKFTGIDFSINFRDKLDYESGKTYYHVANEQTFTDVMKDYFDYIYIVNPDEEFRDAYSQLFSDGMTKGTLYKITDSEIPMQAVII